MSPTTIIKISLLLLLALPSCGRRTPPIPPGAAIPTPITDLGYNLDSKGVNLHWSYPATSMDGSAVTEIRSFLVDKAEIPVADYCQGCPVLYDETIEVAAAEQTAGQTITLRDNAIRPGHYYLYRVRANAGWRIISKQSNRQTFRLDSPFAAPGNIKIETGDQALTISWQPIQQRQDGSSLDKPPAYQVFRSQDNQPFQPISPPLSQPRYRDEGLRNDQAYSYQVYGVQGENGEIRGLPSATVSATPLDMTPPLPPSELSVVLTQQGTRLIWRPSPDPDVGGYRIYRRHQQGPSKLLGSTAAGAISFTDHDKLQPGLYHYIITAFDQGGRHNESKHSAEVQLRVP